MSTRDGGTDTAAIREWLATAEGQEALAKAIRDGEIAAQHLREQRKVDYRILDMPFCLPANHYGYGSVAEFLTPDDQGGE